tara:strand:- start:80 stop:520 length:441 start_codon:yes stop_codon:yes gene_type:complete
MENRFKFRAWSGKVMVYQNEDGSADYQDGWLASDVEIVNTLFSYRDEYTWMQCTGIKDKSGRLIYEGDLLRIPAVNNYEKETFNCFEVFFHNGDCSGQNVGFVMNRMHTQGHSAGGQGYRFIPSVLAEFEIIGNIHEKPELLKEEK